jgi:hypothetical protein
VDCRLWSGALSLMVIICLLMVKMNHRFPIVVQEAVTCFSTLSRRLSGGKGEKYETVILRMDDNCGIIL